MAFQFLLINLFYLAKVSRRTRMQMLQHPAPQEVTLDSLTWLKGCRGFGAALVINRSITKGDNS